MTLRSRLTLLYVLLLGGLQLVLGLVLYQVISTVVQQDIDSALEGLANRVINRLNAPGSKPDSVFARLGDELSNENAGEFIQLWNTTENLVWVWPQRIGFVQKPLFRQGLYRNDSSFVSLEYAEMHLRVYSLHLMRGGQPFGVLQIGASLEVWDRLRNTLLQILLIWSLTTAVGAGLVVWLATRRMLAPIEAVTHVALQITRADDLSRRIPHYGLKENDEIGQLIAAFNQTLERLEQLFVSQRRFLADVSHELRTPLTVIKGNAALLRHVPEQDLESIESIENEVDRLTRLVGDLLTISRAESGRLPLTRTWVELDVLVLEAMRELSVLAQGQVSLSVREFDQVQVCADRDRLKQVLVNLIGNAIRYTPQGGKVYVGLGQEGSQVFLRVADTGLGIGAEDLPHIFGRFYRAEKARTRSRDGHGFGLGLSIAYWVVHAHGGHIAVDSAPGKGTTFTVWLPQSHPDCAAEPSHPDA
ncbi:MAG: hypothetical protein Fur0018_03050 [Anaerolineales bacterium]